MSIEIGVPQTTINNRVIDVEYSNNNTAIAEGTKEMEVSVNRREYSIVGDELYIPKRYEDAPQWLRDIIDTVTNASISGALSDVSTLGDMLNGLIAELNVAKNAYTQSIISDNDIDERINTAITTLNSTLANADSTVLDIALTRVTPEEAETIVTNILSASIAGGDISAAVQNLQTAIADVDNARAQDYIALNASIGDEFEATAAAISTINAYVGIDEAGASTGTGLSAYLEDSNGVIGGADSQLNNTIKVTAEEIESKFEYNSIVNINGIYKKSGFGLTTNYTSGSGTEANPYVSEFWIDASRLKFTNSNNTGQVSPFTIDASGTTPQVKFKGVVEFSSISDSATYIPTISSVMAAQATANTAIENVIKGTNLIYEDWGIGRGSTAVYTQNGTSAENYRTYGNNHLGQRVVLWECRPDGVRDADGGWDTNSFTVDKTKSYRFSVFVKTSANTGTTYFGCGRDTVVNLNTSTLNANPYFWAGDLPTQNEWYLLVGYVHPYSSTGITTKGGIYNCTTGAKVANISSDFAWSSITTTSYHRCYHYYDTTTTTRQWMWNPRVEQITGNEPSILDLIGNFTKVEDISWQTEVQAAINNDATTIDGGKIVTNTLYGDRLIGNTVSADRLTASTGTSTVWTGGGLVSQNFNGNVAGSIGSPTKGFRLSANAAGTSTDPNIYGAYIKGGTVEGVNLIGTQLSVADIKINAEGYPNNFGKVLIKKVNTIFGSNGYTNAITLYSRSYDTGFISNRLCNVSPVITIVASSSGVVMETASWTITASIQISYDGITWNTISSSSPSYSSSTSTSIDFTPTSNFTILYIRSYHAHSRGGSRMSAGSIQIDVINGLN